MTTDIVIPSEVREQSIGVVARANEMVVANSDDYQLAADLLRSIKTVRDNIAATFDEPIKAAHMAHKSMLEAKKKHEAPLSMAEVVVKGKMSRWTTEQERIRREQEAQLREQARREEEDRRLREAEELERQGEAEAAQELVSAPVATPTVVIPKSVPKVEGISTRRTWKFRIVNESIIPRDYLMPDEKKIGGVARSMGEAARIPGVEVYAEDTISGRAF